MTNLRLIRLEENFTYGTFGVLLIDSLVFCVTLEPPDVLNQKNVSNIPPQQYRCIRYKSQRYGSTWQVHNVPGRTYILFHPGNVLDHTQGCILLAQHWGKLHFPEERRAIINSGNTHKEFMSITSEDTVLHLTVKEEY